MQSKGFQLAPNLLRLLRGIIGSFLFFVVASQPLYIVALFVIMTNTAARMFRRWNINQPALSRLQIAVSFPILLICISVGLISLGVGLSILAYGLEVSSGLLYSLNDRVSYLNATIALILQFTLLVVQYILDGDFHHGVSPIY